jgi:hypothetical protein
MGALVIPAQAGMTERRNPETTTPQKQLMSMH